MGFLKKLKKLVKKVDPIGSAIANKTHKIAGKALSHDPLGKALLKNDPVAKAVMRNKAMGGALRQMNPELANVISPERQAAMQQAGMGQAQQQPAGPIPGVVPPTPVPPMDQSAGQMPDQSGQIPAPVGPPPTPMGQAPAPAPMMNQGPMGPGQMNPMGGMGMGPRPMSSPMARGAALRGFGGGGNRRFGGGY